jgi:hypothetical protein
MLMRTHSTNTILLLLVILFLGLPPTVVAQESPAPIGTDARWHTFSTENGLAGNSVQAIWEDPDGTIWVGTENGVGHYDGQDWTSYRMEDGLLDNNVWSISGDASSVWCATSSGVSVLRDGEWSSYTTQDGLPINDVRAILVSQNGTVWAGTFGQGIAWKKPDEQRWATFELPPHLQNRGMVVQSIWQDAVGDLWFSTSGFGALRLDEQRFEQFTFRLGRHNTVWAVGAERESGVTWFATLRGIVRIAPDDSVQIIDETVEGVRIVESEVLAVAGGEAEEVWFGTRTQGVLRRTAEGTWERYVAQDGLGRNYIMTILVDRAGRVWFGTRGNGVTMLDRRPLDTSLLRSEIAARDISNERQLPPDTAVLHYNQNNLQFQFKQQAAWIPPQDVQFQYWLEHREHEQRPPIKTVQCTPDSSASSQMFIDLAPGEYTLHVRAMLNGQRGPETTYPFTIRSAPPVILADALDVQSNGYAIEQELTLPQTLFGARREVDLHLMARDDVTGPEYVQYRYRVDSGAIDAAEQTESEWQQTSDDHIMLALGQGQHRFEIQAIDSDGNRSDPITLAVRVPPPLWNTILFYMLLILLPGFGGSIAGAIGYRRWTRYQALRRAVKGYVIPYDVGPLITTSDRYIGRRHVMDTILGKIHNNSFYLYGEKRIGKTSLLLQLKERFNQRNFMQQEQYTLAVFRNMQDLPQEQFWLYLVRSVASEMESPLPHLAALEDYQSGYDDFDAESDLEQMVVHLQRQMGVQQVTIVLLLDEVDTLSTYDSVIRQRFRAFCQHMQHRVRVVLAGVLPPGGESSDTSPWYNIFEPLSLGPLAKEDILHLIRAYNNNPYPYTPAAEQAIMTAGAGKPFDTQWLCSEAVKAMLSARRSRVTLADATHAIQTVTRERESQYAGCWQAIGKSARDLLRQSHQEGKDIPLETLSRLEQECLVEAGVIRQHNGHYRLTVLAHYWLANSEVVGSG